MCENTWGQTENSMGRMEGRKDKKGNCVALGQGKAWADDEEPFTIWLTPLSQRYCDHFSSWILFMFIHISWAFPFSTRNFPKWVVIVEVGMKVMKAFLLLFLFSRALDKLQPLSSEGRKYFRVTQNITQECLCIILESQWSCLKYQVKPGKWFFTLHETDSSSWGLNCLCWIDNTSTRIKVFIICKLP